MKNVYSFKSVTNLLLLILPLAYSILIEDYAKRRLTFSQKRDVFSERKVKYKYSESRGVFCVARKDLHQNEVLYSFPIEAVTCGYEIFPFKLEISEAILNSLKKEEAETNLTNLAIYLLPFQLMFYSYHDKSRVVNSLPNNFSHYLKYNVSPLIETYLSNLQEEHFNEAFYAEEEHELMKVLGSPFNEKLTAISIHKHVVQYLRTNYPSLYDAFEPWGGNFDRFRFYLANVISRHFTVKFIKDSKKVKVVTTRLSNVYKSFVEKSNSKIDLKLLTNFNNILIDMCMVPLFDNCNTIVPTRRLKVDYFTHSLTYDYKKEKIEIKINKEYKKDEEISYFYSKDLSNKDLIRSYGFYKKDNLVMKNTIIAMLDLDEFSQLKYLTCKNLGCFESGEDIGSLMNQYKGQKLHIPLRFTITPNTIVRFLNFIRILAIDNKATFEPDKLVRWIKKNKYIDVSNENKARTNFHAYITFRYLNDQMSLEGLLRLIQVSRNNYSSLIREDTALKLTPNLKSRYKLREMIVYERYEEVKLFQKSLLRNLNGFIKFTYSELKSFKEEMFN